MAGKEHVSVSRVAPLPEKVADCRRRTLDDGEEKLKWRPVASNDLASGSDLTSWAVPLSAMTSGRATERPVNLSARPKNGHFTARAAIRRRAPSWAWCPRTQG